MSDLETLTTRELVDRARAYLASDLLPRSVAFLTDWSLTHPANEEGVRKVSAEIILFAERSGYTLKTDNHGFWVSGNDIALREALDVVLGEESSEQATIMQWFWNEDHIEVDRAPFLDFLAEKLCEMGFKRVTDSRRGSVVEEIPAGVLRYRGMPNFVKWPNDSDEYKVWGPERLVVVGEPCWVERWQDESICVEPLEIVGQRLALKRDGSRVRYVLATFDSAAEDDNGLS